MCSSCVDRKLVHPGDSRNTKFDALISDLDRCPHGRHQKDPCFGCEKTGSNNVGNPYLTPGTRIGTTLYGQPIIVPEWNEKDNPDAWVKND